MDTYYFLEKALRSLTAEEHSRFEKFLHSPYFHLPGTSMCCVCRFYKCIKDYYIPSTHSFAKFDWEKIMYKWLALIRGGVVAQMDKWWAGRS